MPSLIAVLAAILLSLQPMAQYFHLVQDGNKRSVIAVTGGQFSMLLGSVKKYIRAHSNDLINEIPVGSSTPVSIATLINEHDLPVGFTTTNPYNQTWTIYVNQSSSGVLDGRVVSYNGQTLDPKDAVAIALKAGAQGGYVPKNGLINGLNSNMAVGASGTWSQAISGYPNPGEGHLIGLVASADDANNNPNYLYTDAITGHPELNTMKTALNMGGNNVNSAADVHAFGTVSSGDDTNNSSVNAYMSKDGRINATKDIRGQIFRPNFIAVSGNPCNGVAIPTGTMDDLASNNGQNSFTTKNGDIATSDTGETLYCVNGTWTGNSVKMTEYVYVSASTNGPTSNTRFSAYPHQFCTLNDTEHDGHDSNCYVGPAGGNYWLVNAQTKAYVWGEPGSTNCGMTCIN